MTAARFSRTRVPTWYPELLWDCSFGSGKLPHRLGVAAQAVGLATAQRPRIRDLCWGRRRGTARTADAEKGTGAIAAEEDGAGRIARIRRASKHQLQLVIGWEFVTWLRLAASCSCPVDRHWHLAQFRFNRRRSRQACPAGCIQRTENLGAGSEVHSRSSDCGVSNPLTGPRGWSMASRATSLSTGVSQNAQST